MKKYTIILLLFLPLLALRCNNDDPDPEDYITPPQDFLDFVQFPEGSWWVYEDTAGIKDSIYVTASGFTEKEDYKHADFLRYQRILGQQMSGNFRNYNYSSDVTSSQQDDDGNITWLYRWIEHYKAAGLSHTADRYKWPVNNDVEYGTKVLFFKHDETFEVLGQTYQDVNSFGYPVQAYGNQITREYFARHIGVVQREMFDGNIWKLKKYHINN